MLHASALVASLVVSVPALAQSGPEQVAAPRAFSRAIPPEMVAAKAVALVVPSHRVVLAAPARRPIPAPAVVMPQTVMPRVSRAIVMSADELPHSVPAVAYRDMAEDAGSVADAPARTSPSSTFAAPSRSGLDASTRCVAMAVYHEARGEPVRGQRAVADVVLNRARSGRWGSGACSVVNAPRQFSNRWSWSNPVPGVASWDRAISIARDAMSGMVGVSSRLMNFRAASMGAGSRSFMRLGNHVFWQ